TVHRERAPVPHGLERVGRERRAKAAAAVEDDLGVPIRDRLLDVALDDTLREVERAASVALRPLPILAHVDQVESLARLLPAVDLLGRRLTDACLGVGDEPEKTRRVLHRSSPTTSAGRR